MLTEYQHILAPIIGLLANTVTQIIIFRLWKERYLLKSVFSGFVCGLMAVLVIEIASLILNRPEGMEFLGQLSMVMVTYFALGYCYFHFINLGETARRIRILRELQESKNGLTLEGILKRYNALAIINVRLQRMISNKQIVLQAGRYYIGSPLMLYMAKTLIFFKWVLLRRRSELQ